MTFLKIMDLLLRNTKYLFLKKVYLIIMCMYVCLCMDIPTHVRLPTDVMNPLGLEFIQL